MVKTTPARKIRTRLWILAIVIFLLGIPGGFAIWAYTPPAPMAEAITALESDAQVSVSGDAWLVFEPVGGGNDTALILYPGGRVDYRSYAPAAHAIAAQGYRVIVVKAPFNLMVFAPNLATEVMAAYPDVQNWVVGGHSLGGAMAALYADEHPESIRGLLLWAAYPAESNDLSDQNIEVTSIYATLDGLSTGDKINASRALLPATTSWVSIEGGNHAQFGWYGDQSGDNAAAISREEQQRWIVLASVELLSRVATGAK
jgi:acetyl esterase/lipase